MTLKDAFILLTELWFSLIRTFWASFRIKGWPELSQPLKKTICGRICASERKIEIFCKERRASLNGLFLENQYMKCGNYQSLRSLAEFHQGDVYVRRNVSDLSILSTSRKEEQPTNQNQLKNNCKL